MPVGWQEAQLLLSTMPSTRVLRFHPPTSVWQPSAVHRRIRHLVAGLAVDLAFRRQRMVQVKGVLRQPRRRKGRRRVAALAVRPKLRVAVRALLFRVAGHAGRRRLAVLQLRIDVAFLALQLGVRPGQVERLHVVLEFRQAGGAIVARQAFHAVLIDVRSPSGRGRVSAWQVTQSSDASR